MELKLGAVFSDNGVLQRGKNITIFGWGPEGCLVEAAVRGEKLWADTPKAARGREEAEARRQTQESRGSAYVRNGRFEIELPPLEAGLDHTLLVSCGEESILRKNLAVGEVWLAGGQSNMEFELQNCEEKAALERPADSMLRFYYTQKKGYMDEAFFETEEKTGWECFGDPGTKSWSAVGYFFGARLREALGVPVGIIGCNWGGTSASAWVPRQAIAGEEQMKIYLDTYDAAVAGKSVEEQLKEYEEYAVYQEEFDRRAAACYAEKPDMEWEEVLQIAGESKWPGPMGCSNPYRPGGLHECMIKRIAPYSLKGFLYYQGESDDHLPHLYRRLFTRLIEQWREDWRDDSLPFIFAQLPMHRYRQDPDFKNWCLIREAQNRVYDTVKNTAMTCIIDQGAYNDIHPKQKRAVGERMSSQALELAYGFRDVPGAVGPLFDYAERGEGELILHFKHAQKGFRVSPPEPMDLPGYDRTAAPAESLGFETAGEDGKYVPARVTVEGDKIHVSSPEVSRPVFARYLWTNYGEAAVYGVEGIPLAPFRTDRRDGFVPLNQSAGLWQNMETGSREG